MAHLFMLVNNKVSAAKSGSGSSRVELNHVALCRYFYCCKSFKVALPRLVIAPAVAVLRITSGIRRSDLYY